MIAVIDTNHLIHKSYYVVKKNYKDFDLDTDKSKGQFFRKVIIDLHGSLKKLRFQPDHIFFTFDSISWRKTISSEYKAHRTGKDISFYEVAQKVHDELCSAGFKAIKSEGAESDDIIGYIASKKMDTLIISGDEDMHQLIDENISVWNNNLKKPILYKDKNSKLFDCLNIKCEEIEVDPIFAWYSKFLLGCSGDGVSPLVKKGVGIKTVEKLYKQLKDEPDVENFDYEIFKYTDFKNMEEYNLKKMLNTRLITLHPDCYPDGVNLLIDLKFKEKYSLNQESIVKLEFLLEK